MRVCDVKPSGRVVVLGAEKTSSPRHKGLSFNNIQTLTRIQSDINFEMDSSIRHRNPVVGLKVGST
jgi:hypothetical protein